MDLTREELAELAALEAEDEERRKVARAAAQRQHLEALRMVKRLAQKHGTPGIDFAICESVIGNVAVRRPTDLEVDADHGDLEQRGVLERFVLDLVLEPTREEVQRLFVQHAGLVAALAGVIAKLQKAVREEDVKK